MPLPFFLAAGAVTALGVTGHAVAKETNEKAEAIVRRSERAYNQKKAEFDEIEKNTKASLERLGSVKAQTIEKPMKHFVVAFQRVKDQIEVSNCENLTEFSRFVLEEKETVELQHMVDVYEDVLTNVAGGAAAGVFVALATSGTLGTVAGGMAVAGQCLLAGHFATASALASGALGIGALFTPASAVVAPVVFFTAFSASLKADENLEKAQEMEAETDYAIAKMESSIVFYQSLDKGATVYRQLLKDLNAVFVPCVKKMYLITKEKCNGEDGTYNSLTQSEQELIMVTASLASAIKAVIDVPLLDNNSKIDPEAVTKYRNYSNESSKLIKSANAVL